MAGTVPQGRANRIYVGASAPPSLGIDHCQGFEFGHQSDISTEEFYDPDNNAAITTLGDLKYDGTGSGKWSFSSPGLQFIKQYARTQALAYMGHAPDGTNGEYAPGRFSRFRFTGGGMRQALGYQFTFNQDGAAANIGGGLE